MSASSMGRWMIALSLVLAAVAAACSSSASPTAPGTSDTGTSSSSGSSGSSGSSSQGGNASFAIHLTDSPFSDAKALLVTFNGVSVHRADGDSWQTVPFVSGSERTCDLKKLNGPTDVLGVGSLPVGKYTQVRLMVSSAKIYFGAASSGAACAPSIAPPDPNGVTVDIPSGEVKLNHEFTLTSGGSTMLLDFDGDKSVRQTGSGNNSGNGGNGNGNGNGQGNGNSGQSGSNTKYMMSPVIRVVSVS